MDQNPQDILRSVRSSALRHTRGWVMGVGLCCIVMQARAGIQFTTIASFNGGDGLGPIGKLVYATDGYLYGMAQLDTGPGYGVIFKVTTNGGITPLHNFTQFDGARPIGGMIQASDGKLYGATVVGDWENVVVKRGTLFSITTNAAFTSFLSFGATNGAAPYGPLVQASDGNLYGTTSAGGSGSEGTCFRLGPGLNHQVLFSFPAGIGLFGPRAGLVQGPDGFLYGVAASGGVENVGGVFKVAISGLGGEPFTVAPLRQTETGAGPLAPLSVGRDGYIYGTATQGGTNGYGTVFRISTNGNVNCLFSFNGTNGSRPDGGVIQGSDGNLYGTTIYGGIGFTQGTRSSGYGTLFMLTTNGVLTTLLQFDSTNGAWPAAALLEMPNGVFYGSTQVGGTNNDGTIFRFSTKPALSLSIVISNHIPSFQFSATAGKMYQLQFKTNATQVSWSDLGGPVLATNASLTLTDAPALNQQRFYRVYQLP
jgi:uncharacterized repeat protein (TIGR03803 family)